MKKYLTTFILALLFIILLSTRFINLGWGLPYPMHPDEHNMATSITQLSCNLKLPTTNYQLITNCFNPHFFAYGQFPLYLGYLMVQIYHVLTKTIGQPILLTEAIISLRLISAISSILTVFVLLKLINLLNPKKSYILYLISFLLLVFSPYFIQFSHFGTTESLLMLFNSLLIYFSLKLITDEAKKENLREEYPADRRENYSRANFSSSVLILSFVSGLALATKVSSLIFLAIPLFALLIRYRSIKMVFFPSVSFFTKTLVFFIIFSPHNFISLPDFLGAIAYESDVGLGRYVAFYTRQFVGTIPVIFQMVKVFPYSLGWPVFVVSIAGFFLLPWKNRQYNLLRIAFIIYFIPNALFFAKWTRFMAPVMPIMSVFAILFIYHLLSTFKNYLLSSIIYLLIILSLIPGLAYLSIYVVPDVRFQASDWIYKNIPANSYILSETANVVDIPISNPTSTDAIYRVSNVPNYQIISFNFYDLDENPTLVSQLQEHLQLADYIFVPSRRIYTNHTCESPGTVYFHEQGKKCDYLQKKYPLINNYYKNLFYGQLGFQEIAKFSSFPKIAMFKKTFFEFPDEGAEETWTVFDHPVVRIFKLTTK